MKYRVRCSYSKCRARKVLDRHPDDYEQQPTCVCGRSKWTVASYRQSGKEAKNQKNCNCNGYIWSCADGFHRWGSKGCIHYKDNVEALKLVAENNTEHKTVDHLEFYGDFDV